MRVTRKESKEPLHRSGSPLRQKEADTPALEQATAWRDPTAPYRRLERLTRPRADAAQLHRVCRSCAPPSPRTKSPAPRIEVIRYVTEKYGADKVAMIGTYGTIKAKNAIKDCAPHRTPAGVTWEREPEKIVHWTHGTFIPPGAPA